MVETKQELKPKQAELRQLVRIANADLVGTKQIYNALRKIKGISYTFSAVICNLMDFDKSKKAGTLTAEEIKKIEDIIKNPKKYNLPSWLLNRRKDLQSGEDLHLIASDLDFRKEFDIKNLKVMKSYRGMRHAAGLPVRGQRTRAHFRTGRAIGVKRKGIKMVGKSAEKVEKKKGADKGKEKVKK